MLRNCRQLLPIHRTSGFLYPAATCKQITKQILCKQTFTSFCIGSNRQIDNFRIVLNSAESALKHKSHRHLHSTESVKPSNVVDATLNESTDVKSDYSAEMKPDWTVHERLISTCTGLWDDNPDGSNFIVGYVDTASHLTRAEKSRLPTVLAVARDLAHSESLRPLLGSLVSSGFRVVMPYLVGSELTRGLTYMDEERFSQTLGERSAFLLDFISSTGINRFDIALGHCLECFPILTLASNFKIFSSVVFICPIPGHTVPRWIQPLKLSLKMIDWFRSSIFSPIATLYFHTYVRQKVATDGHASAKGLHLCVEIAHGINYDTVPGFAMMFESRRTPILYVYCDADPMVDSKLSGEFAEIFGITSDLTDSYNSDGQLVDKSTRSSGRYAKAVRLSAQTHFPQNEKNPRDVILKELIELHKDASAKRTAITSS